MKIIITKLKTINKKILFTLYTGLKICFVLLLFSTFCLSLYHSISNYNLFYIGITLFKASLFYIVFLIICAISIDTIGKDLK